MDFSDLLLDGERYRVRLFCVYDEGNIMNMGLVYSKDNELLCGSILDPAPWPKRDLFDDEDSAPSTDDCYVAELEVLMKRIPMESHDDINRLAARIVDFCLAPHKDYLEKPIEPDEEESWPYECPSIDDSLALATRIMQGKLSYHDPVQLVAARYLHSDYGQRYFDQLFNPPRTLEAKYLTRFNKMGMLERSGLGRSPLELEDELQDAKIELQVFDEENERKKRMVKFVSAHEL